MIYILIKRGHLDTGTERHTGRRKRSGVMHRQATERQRLTANHLQHGEECRKDSPSQPRKEPTLPAPRSRTSSLQNWETTNFCYFSCSHRLGMAALATHCPRVTQCPSVSVYAVPSPQLTPPITRGMPILLSSTDCPSPVTLQFQSPGGRGL